MLLSVLGSLSLLQQNIDLLHQFMEADLIKRTLSSINLLSGIADYWPGMLSTVVSVIADLSKCTLFSPFDSRFRLCACPLSTVEVAHHYLKWDAQFSILLSLFSCSRGSLANMTRTHMTQSVSV